MPLTDKKTQFQLALLDFGIPEVATQLAWEQDSWVEATKTVRFSDKHVRALPEIKAMFVVALDLYKDRDSWEDIARAWKGRKG